MCPPAWVATEAMLRIRHRDSRGPSESGFKLVSESVTVRCSKLPLEMRRADSDLNPEVTALSGNLRNPSPAAQSRMRARDDRDTSPLRCLCRSRLRVTAGAAIGRGAHLEWKQNHQHL